MRRRLNAGRIKLHRTYTVHELARTLGVHKNTVRAWLAIGLATIDDARPALILGSVAIDFFRQRRQLAKRPCSAGQLYCVRCREPKTPAHNFADYVPLSATSGNLRGFCPVCETVMHRRVSLATLDLVRADLELSFPQALPHIGDSTSLSANCDSKQER
jgi:hypothetical protein